MRNDCKNLELLGLEKRLEKLKDKLVFHDIFKVIIILNMLKRWE